MRSIPRLNLTVIRSSDLERAVRFYEAVGLIFTKHTHGSGPLHYAWEGDGQTFEIYSLLPGSPATIGTRIGFAVADVDETVKLLLSAGGLLVAPAKESPWGLRAVVADPDGHRVELTSAST